jgi:hypothetical protein
MLHQFCEVKRQRAAKLCLKILRLLGDSRSPWASDSLPGRCQTTDSDDAIAGLRKTYASAYSPDTETPVSDTIRVEPKRLDFVILMVFLVDLALLASAMPEAWLKSSQFDY